jgi:hypothetical protein
MHILYKSLHFYRIIVFAFILHILPLFSGIISAQTPENATIENLKQKFPNENVVVSWSQKTYSFEIPAKGQQLTVVEDSEMQYISLRSGKSFVQSIFYDSYSEILNQSVRGTGIHKPANDRRCGNFETAGLFYHDAKVCLYRLWFEEAGDQLRLKTRKKIYEPGYFPKIPLHEQLAVNSGLVKLVVPNSVDLVIHEVNLDEFAITKTENIVGRFRHIEYRFNDIPSAAKLDNLPAYACTFPHLLVNIKGYWQNNSYVKVFAELGDIYKWYLSLVPESTISDALAEHTLNLVADLDTDRARISAVYEWIHDKIRYIAFVDGIAAYAPENPDMVFNNMYGDCKGMALLAKTMLQYLGFDARLTWLYSGNSCYPRDMVSLAIDNHMICTVLLNDTLIYIDPTVSYDLFSELPDGIQGRSCVIEDGDSWMTAEISETLPSTNSIAIQHTIEVVGSSLKLEGTTSLKGAARHLLQYGLVNVPDKNRSDLLSDFITQGDSRIEMHAIKVVIDDSFTPDFKLEYGLHVNNAVLYAENKVLLNLDYLNDFMSFKIESTRSFPYDIGFRRIHTHHISLYIPEGYRLAEMPEGFVLEHPKFRFELSYQLNGDLLVYHKQLALLEAVLQPQDFDAWNQAKEKLTKTYRDVVILEKIP